MKSKRKRTKSALQAISIDARKGVWVSAIFSFKTLTWLWDSSEKINKFELTDWLQRTRRSKDLWNGTFVCCTCSKDLHNGTLDGSPLANGGKAN